MGAGYGTGQASGMATNGAIAPVVCGIGGGDAGRRAAAFAAGLADALGAPLVAVRAEAVLRPGGSRGAVVRGHARLNDVLRKAQLERRAVTCTVKLGDPATALVAVAEETRSQLLVVGTGPSGPPLGGVPREVAMRASCPVLVLPYTRPTTAKPARQRHLLCAFDGSDDARATLGVGATVAQRLGTAAFVAHMRPGSVDDLRASAHARQAAMVVASSRAVAGWHSSVPRSSEDESTPIGWIPLLLVPPARTRGLPG